MILGINCGRELMRGELGAGISALWIESAEPSSKRRVRRVKTERTRKRTMRVLMKRKILRARRMVGVSHGGNCFGRGDCANEMYLRGAEEVEEGERCGEVW